MTPELDKLLERVESKSVKLAALLRVAVRISEAEEYRRGRLDTMDLLNQRENKVKS